MATSSTRAASTRTKALVLMHGIIQRARKVWALPANPVADVEKPPVRGAVIWWCSRLRRCGRWCGPPSEADGALFLAAAFTGLAMGELLALRWRDVDFAGSAVRVRASCYAGNLTTPKSGKVRAVPLSPHVLARRLGVAPAHRTALATAGLRPLRFHDLRHTFGTRMIAKAFAVAQPADDTVRAD